MPKRKGDGQGFQKRRLANQASALFEARKEKQPRIADFWLITAMWLAGHATDDIYIAQLQVLGYKYHTQRFKQKLDALEQGAAEEVEVEQYASTEKF